MPIAIYHRVMKREGFEETAKILLELLQDTQKKNPDEPRDLYLDISGHRTEEGGFDAEMLELQKEFVLGFLGKYFTNIHMPLLSAKNQNEQRNDVPEELIIMNALEDKEDELAALYIENYSNTEFASEEPVYEFLKNLSGLIVDLHSIHPMHHSITEDGTHEWRFYWHSYLMDLVTELFDGFILGNLISVSAMTRTLIESYAYISLFDQNIEGDLIPQWQAFSIYSIAQKMHERCDSCGNDLLHELCETAHLSYETIAEKRRKYGDNAWLCGLMGNKRISFRSISEFLGDPLLYEDFQQACSYIHGQDITTKSSPFTYYEVISGKLYLMTVYIFKVLALLFPDEKEIHERIEFLYADLLELCRQYNKISK